MITAAQPLPGPRTLDLFLTAAEPLLPIPALLVLLPALWWLFRSTWRELDQDATAWRLRMSTEGRTDMRPFVALMICAAVLTMQEYYGTRGYYVDVIHPWLATLGIKHPHTIRVAKYDELYNFGWWAVTRASGYILPLGIWKVVFREDSLLDMGFRGRGFFSHAWIYLLFVVAVVPLVFIISRKPDFSSYYPFYKGASRSWADFLAWEAMYFAQFFALEVFFRGFWLGALRRSFGSGAIFAMAVPYCMIHYGKPYLEANAAIVAGVALGSLSMKTKSIYQGFLVHITVAGLMDWLALSHAHALPKVFWAPG